MAAARQRERALEARKRHHERIAAAKYTERREARRRALDEGEASGQTHGETMVQSRRADEGEAELPGGDPVDLWGRAGHDQGRVDNWEYGEIRERLEKIREDLDKEINPPFITREYQADLRRELSELESMGRKLGIKADGQRGLLARTMSLGKSAVGAVKRRVTPGSKIYMDTHTDLG